MLIIPASLPASTTGTWPHPLVGYQGHHLGQMIVQGAGDYVAGHEMSGRAFQNSEPVVGHPEHNVALADDAVDMLPVTADDQGSDSLDSHLLAHLRDECVGGDCLDLRPLGSQNGSDIHALTSAPVPSP